MALLSGWGCCFLASSGLLDEDGADDRRRIALGLTFKWDIPGDFALATLVFGEEGFFDTAVGVLNTLLKLPLGELIDLDVEDDPLLSPREDLARDAEAVDEDGGCNPLPLLDPEDSEDEGLLPPL